MTLARPAPPDEERFLGQDINADPDVEPPPPLITEDPPAAFVLGTDKWGMPRVRRALESEREHLRQRAADPANQPLQGPSTLYAGPSYYAKRNDWTPEMAARLQTFVVGANVRGYSNPEGIGRQVATFLSRHPEFAPVFDEDFNQGVNLTLADVLLERLAAVNPLMDYDSIPDRTYRAINEMLAEVGTRFSAANVVQRDTDTIASGPFQTRELDRTIIAERLDQLAPVTTGRVDVGFASGGAVAQGDVELRGHVHVALRAQVNSILDDLSGTQRYLETYYNQQAGRLLGVVTYKDDSQGMIDVRLSPGTVVNGPEDAVWALTVALAGVDHEIVGDADLRGHQTLLGKAWEGLGIIGDGYDRVNAPLNAAANLIINPGASPSESWRSSWQIQRDRNKERIANALDSARSQVDQDFAIVSAALALDAEYPGRTLEVAQASIFAFDGASAAEQDQIIADLKDLTPELVRSEVEALTDDRNSIKRFLDKGVEETMSAFAVYDAFIQTGAVGFFAMVEGTLGTLVDPAGGFDNFRRVIDKMNETEAFSGERRVSNYFGIDPGPLATSADLVSSLALDPLVWITPGGKGLARTAQWRLTTTEGVESMMALPVMRRKTIQVAEALRGQNLMAADAYLAGLPSKYWREVMALGDAATPEQVAGILKKATPAYGGAYIPNLSGHATLRNSAEQIALMYRNLSTASERAGRTLRTMFAVFSGNRTASVSTFDFLDDARSLIYQRYHGNPQGAERALRSVVQVYDDVTLGGGRLRAATSARMDDLRARLRDQLEATPMEVRTFDRTRQSILQAEQRVADIDNAVTRGVATPEMLAERELILRADRQARIDALRAARKKIKKQSKPVRRPVAGIGIDVAERPTRAQAAAAQLRAIDKELEQLTSVPSLPFASDSATFADLAAQHDAYITARTPMAKELDDLREVAKVATLPLDRTPLQRWYDDFMYDWLDEAGVPHLPGKLDKAGRPVHDTSVITGDRSFSAFDEATNIAPLADDPDLVASLEVTSFGTVPGTHQLPVSPQELLAYQAVNNGNVWEKFITRAPDAQLRRMGRFVNTLQRVWTTTLLINPRTIFRSNVDEPIRQIINQGRLFGGKSRIVGFDASGPIYGNITPPGLTPFRQFVTRDMPNRLARGRRLEMSTPWERGSSRGYTIVEPGKPGFVDAGNFWLSGVVLNDPVTRQAWAAGSKDEFLRWWDESGDHFARAGEYRTADGALLPVSAETAWQSRQNLLDMIVDWMPEARQAEFRAALLGAAQGGPDVPSALLRQITRGLPGRVTNADRKLNPFGDWLFNRFYGRVGAERGGLVYQSYFDQYAQLLWQGNAGRVLTPQRLADLTGNTVDEMAKAMRLASGHLENFADQMGMVLPVHLERAAHKLALDQANSMMYQTAAMSAFGRKAQKIFPFARAQYDFLGWYGREMTNALELGLNPSIQTALSKVPGIRKVVDPGVPFFGHAVQPGIGSRFVPANLRLLARMGEIFGLAAHQQEGLREGERAEFAGPLDVLDEFTFMPLHFNDTFLLDLGPGFGPLPAFAIHLLPPEADGSFFGMSGKWAEFGARVRDIAETIDLGQTFDPGQITWTDALEGAFDSIVPSGRLSLRGGLEALTKTAVGEATRRLGAPLDATLWWFDTVGRPVGYRPAYKANLGDLLEREPFLSAQIRNGEPAMSTNMQEQLVTLVQDTYTQVQSEDGFRTVKRWLPILPLSEADRDGTTVRHWRGVVEELPLLQARGLVGEAAAVRLADLWQRSQADEVTPQVLRSLTDAAADVLFNLPDLEQSYLLVKYPGMAVNLVSSYRCGDRPGAPEGVCQAGRLRLPPGEDGDRMFRQGRDEGWIIPKTEDEIAVEAAVRLANARRDLSAQLWTLQVERANQFWPDDPLSSRWHGTYAKRLDQVQGLTFTEQQIDFWSKAVDVDLAPTMTYQELFDAVKGARDRWSASTFQPFGGGTIAESELLASRDPLAGELVEGLDKIAEMGESNGWESFADYPADIQEAVRDRFRRVIDRGSLALRDYERDYAGIFGPLDWTAPVPPPVGELDFRIDAAPHDVIVLDGDTVDVRTPDGRSFRVRFIGINAADENPLNPEQDALAREHRAALRALIRGAEEVSFGMWDAERFGTFRDRDPDTDEVRYLMWLYVDGEPVYDPSVFTFRNPTGVSSTGAGVP